MKKLSTLAGLLLLFAANLAAQRNSIAALFGPSPLRFVPDQVQKSESTPPMGFVTGLDYFRQIKGGWGFKLGIRYANWQVPTLDGPYAWPSEHDGNGGYTYDPSLQHYINQGYKSCNAWQWLLGTGWESRPDDFQGFVQAEFGATRFAQNEARIDTRAHPTAGLLFGASWEFAPRLRAFISPSARMIFRGGSKRYAEKFNLFSMQVELGLRYAFSKL